MEKKTNDSRSKKSPALHTNPTILMADGSSKTLDQLSTGDTIRNGEMGDTIISSVQRIPIHTKRSYGINGNTAFLSEDQAVMTQRGWCSLHPKNTKDFHPMLRIGQLRIGDIAWVLNDQLQQTLVEVTEIIEVQIVERSYQLNFHARQGNPSCWLNGFCVLINDPAISMSRTASNIAGKLSNKEQKELKNKLDAMRPLLEQSFGKTVVNAAMDMMKNPQQRAAGLSGNNKNLTRLIDLKDFILPSMLVVAKDPTKPLPEDFKNLSLVHGNLVIDGTLVTSHTEGNHLFWTRTINGSIQESGTIQFSPARHHGVGVLEVNGTKIAFSVFSEVDYSTVLTNTQSPWYEFDMQFTEINNQRVSIGVLKDQQGNELTSDEVTVTLSTVLDAQKVPHLAANIEWTPTYVAWKKSKWIAAEISWSSDYRTFSGQAYAYDNTQPQNRGAASPIAGTATNLDAVDRYMSHLKDMQLNAVDQPNFVALANSSQPNSIGIQRAAELVGDVPLTVEALFSLAPPDMSQVHENCFSTIKNMMLYVIPDQQLAWFNETRPGVGPGQALSTSQATLAQTDPDINTFLTNNFALGYLTQAFSQSTDPKISALIGDQATKDKLGYFWQGTGDNCFPKLKGYNLAAAHVMDNTYASMVPGLEQYVQDTASNWGKQLYEYCLNSATLNGLAMQNMMAGGSDMINSLAMKLHCLSPTDTVVVGDKTVSYATSLYESIVNVRLQNISQNYTSGSEEDMVEYLTAFLQEYFTNLINGGDKWPDEIRAAATKDLNDYMTENGIKGIQDLMTNLGGVISGLATVLINANSEPLTLRLAQFAESYPKIAKLGGMLTYATYAMCFVNLYQAITNWKNLTPVQKAQVITTTAYSVVSLFSKFASYKAAKALTAGGTPGPDQMNAALDLNNDLVANDFVPAGDDIVETIGTSAAESNAPLLIDAGQAAGEIINTAEGTTAIVSRWTSIANVSGKIAEGLGVLAMAGACVATGFEIANDFKTGQPWDIKMLDILEEISNGVCFLISAGVTIAGLIGAEVASFIPVIGIVVAVIGIVIAIVELFVHRDPPPTPEETFVSDHCVPFVNGLLAPPQTWLDNRAKAQQHLNGN